MITYRNPIWNKTIQFLEALRDWNYFTDNFNGKFSKRIASILDQALSNCYISGTSWKLITDTFQYVNEKDVSSHMMEVFDQAGRLNLKCRTTKNGKEIFEAAELSLRERKVKEAFDAELEKAQQELEKKIQAHEEYESEKARTKKEKEEAEKKLKELKKKIEQAQKADSIEEIFNKTTEDVETPEEVLVGN